MCVERPRRGRLTNMFHLLANDLNAMKDGFIHTVRGWIRIWVRIIHNTFRVRNENPEDLTDRQHKILENCEQLITLKHTLTADSSDEDEESDDFSGKSSLSLSETPTSPFELANLDDFAEFEAI